MTGTKSFISGGNYSDLYVVMCRTGDDSPKGISALLVDSDADGLSFGAAEQKMGWRGQPTAQVIMDNCAVPSQNLLGEEGKGFSYAMKGLDGGRLNIAAAALGGAQMAYNKALIYAKDRQAFGKSIDQFQSMQFKLADMFTQLEAARTFLRQAAWKLDNGSADATRSCAWPNNLSLIPVLMWPTRRYRSMADMAILRITGLKKLCVICGCIRYWKAQTKLCA